MPIISILRRLRQGGTWAHAHLGLCSETMSEKFFLKNVFFRLWLIPGNWNHRREPSDKGPLRLFLHIKLLNRTCKPSPSGHTEINPHCLRRCTRLAPCLPPLSSRHWRQGLLTELHPQPFLIVYFETRPHKCLGWTLACSPPGSATHVLEFQGCSNTPSILAFFYVFLSIKYPLFSVPILLRASVFLPLARSHYLSKLSSRIRLLKKCYLCLCHCHHSLQRVHFFQLRNIL